MNIQTDLGLQRTSFPTLGLIGDYIFAYDDSKQIELEDLQNELESEEYKRKKKSHIKEIVDSSMMSDKEIEMMREEFGPALQMDAHHNA
jgi:hypothetical protein